MNIRYLLLASTLTLTACGTDTESVSSTQQSETINKVETEEGAVKRVHTNTYTETASQTTAKPVTPASAAITESKIALPLGRLTGIIDTGTYKQAIIDNQGQIIRLKEGDDWQGWTVTSIHPEKIAINHNKEDHSLLLLSEFRSPQLTQTELDNKASEQTNIQEGVKQQASTEVTAPPFTEEQLTELRSRLLMGR